MQRHCSGCLCLLASVESKLIAAWQNWRFFHMFSVQDIALLWQLACSKDDHVAPLDALYKSAIFIAKYWRTL